MNKIAKVCKAVVVLGLGGLLLSQVGCGSDADTASYNLKKEAEQFRIQRRIVFINGITDSTPLIIQGRCSVEDYSGRLEVTCKDNDGSFKNHYMYLSDNMSYVTEQLEGSDVSTNRYKVIWKPLQVVPDIELSM